MKTTLIVVLALFGAVNCGHISSSGHSGGKGSSYSSSGLKTIAQGSAHQAHSAVASQHAAARQASYVAKSTLAQAASQAAATAQAALAGKRILLQNLEEQSSEAHQQLEAELGHLKLAQAATSAAASVAKLAAAQVSEVTSALNSAQGVAVHAEEAAQKAAAELASQIAMVSKAKARLQSIEHQLNTVLLEYAATQEAAEKAAAAAQEAQHNAAQAGQRAALELHQVAEKQGGGHGESSSYTEAKYIESHGHS
ncbi:unnamed protein product [Hermetia illucens]|uniref:Uncharacterized protein n=1 Tax=Hermetia illucens TaxID=343691 RepID=A0A7R8V7J4_HERIL|nr:uncharacterized protein CG45076-like [Hermetia illucens]CAD7093555.1 unnamed protein product [Hermetia illucens]